MNKDEDVHLGSGAYLHFDGHEFELRANSHDNPTDRVFLSSYATRKLEKILREHLAVVDGAGKS